MSFSRTAQCKQPCFYRWQMRACERCSEEARVWRTVQPYPQTSSDQGACLYVTLPPRNVFIWTACCFTFLFPLVFRRSNLWHLSYEPPSRLLCKPNVPRCSTRCPFLPQRCPLLKRTWAWRKRNCAKPFPTLSFRSKTSMKGMLTCLSCVLNMWRTSMYTCEALRYLILLKT